MKAKFSQILFIYIHILIRYQHFALKNERKNRGTHASRPSPFPQSSPRTRTAATLMQN